MSFSGILRPRCADQRGHGRVGKFCPAANAAPAGRATGTRPAPASTPKRVQPDSGVGVVWWGLHADGGWNCQPSLGRGTGQARGLPLRWSRRSLTWGRRVGPQVSLGRNDRTLGGGSGVRGALRGESPRTREGRRPERPELQLPVASGRLTVTSCQFPVASFQRPVARNCRGGARWAACNTGSQ